MEGSKALRCHHATHQIRFANTPSISYDYVANTINSHVNIARSIKCDYIASASDFSDNCFDYAKCESENYMQNNMHAFNTNSAPSDTNHAYVFSHISVMLQSQMPVYNQQG
jgi:hypothetical protein